MLAVPKCTTKNKETAKRMKKEKKACPTGILYFGKTESITLVQKSLVPLLDETPDLGKVTHFRLHLKIKPQATPNHNSPWEKKPNTYDYETKLIKATSLGYPNRRPNEGKSGDLKAFVQVAFYYRYQGKRKAV